MNQPKTETAPSRARKILEYFAVFTAGGVVVHAIAMLINAATGYSHAHDSSYGWLSLMFSPSMGPMIIVYGALTTACFALYQSREQALSERATARSEIERTLTTIDSFAALSAVIIDLVATQNNRIIGWATTKEGKGTQVPATVKEASRNIARVLRELSTYMVDLTPQNRSENRRLRRHVILDHFLAQLETRTQAALDEPYDAVSKTGAEKKRRPGGGPPHVDREEGL